MSSFFLFPADPEGPGVCATILTLVSFILVLVTMPLSLCVTVKVRKRKRKRSTFKDRRRPNEKAKKGWMKSGTGANQRQRKMRDSPKFCRLHNFFNLKLWNSICVCLKKVVQICGDFCPYFFALSPLITARKSLGKRKGCFDDRGVNRRGKKRKRVPKTYSFRLHPRQRAMPPISHPLKHPSFSIYHLLRNGKLFRRNTGHAVKAKKYQHDIIKRKMKKVFISEWRKKAVGVYSRHRKSPEWKRKTFGISGGRL